MTRVIEGASPGTSAGRAPGRPGALAVTQCVMLLPAESPAVVRRHNSSPA